MFTSSKMKPAPAPRVPSDDVLPVHPIDGSTVIRNMTMGTGFRFNQVLDCDMIHGALVRLLKIGDWKRLGGRLRLMESDKGKVEIHIPQDFTAERPAVRYTHIHYDAKIDQHPLGSRFPHPTIGGGPAVLPATDGFMDLLEPDSTLHTFEDYLNGDHPQISLHCVTFRDATLITMKSPHTMTDAMGRHALIQNWSRTLAGREYDVPKLAGSREDVVTRVADLGTSNQSSAVDKIKVAGHNPLSGPGFLYFIGRVLWDRFRGDKAVMRTVYLPAKTMQILKNQARSHITESSAPDTGDRSVSPYVSEGDILTAWTSKMTFSTYPKTSTQDVSVVNAIDLRARVPQVFAKKNPTPHDPVWVQNLIILAYTHISVKSLLAEPLGNLALQIRTSVQKQATWQSLARYCHYVLNRLYQGKLMPLFVKPTSLMFTASNWHCAKLFEVTDFSPAVEKDCTQDHLNGEIDWPKEAKPGKPVSVLPLTFAGTREMKNNWLIGGRDAGGGYWIQGYLTDATWANVEKELERLKALEKD
ncbi:hypothetical protein V8F33_002606 [Rhypophila sp. PSN 637]